MRMSFECRRVPMPQVFVCEPSWTSDEYISAGLMSHYLWSFLIVCLCCVLLLLQAERTAARMISEGRMTGRIDQVEEIVYFVGKLPASGLCCFFPSKFPFVSSSLATTTTPALLKPPSVHSACIQSLRHGLFRSVASFSFSCFAPCLNSQQNLRQNLGSLSLSTIVLRAEANPMPMLDERISKLCSQTNDIFGKIQAAHPEWTEATLENISRLAVTEAS